MAGYKLANGTTIDFSASFGTEVDVSSISNATQAVVTTATAHGFVVGDSVVLTAPWSKLTNRAFYVSAVTGNTFTLENTDTTNTTTYPANAAWVGANAVKVGTWVQIPEVLTLAMDGGTQNFLTFQFLEDAQEHNIPTVKTALTVTLTVADDPDQAYVPIVEAADEDQETRVVKFNLPNGDSILMNAIVSITQVPTMTINELLQREISLALQAKITRHFAA